MPVAQVQENDGNIGSTRQTSVTVTTSSNLASGNVVTVEISSNNKPGFSAPDGTWTSIVRQENGTSHVLEAFQHVVQAGEVGSTGSWVFSVASGPSRSLCWHCHEWSGVDTTTPIDGTPTGVTASSTSIGVPAITVGDGAAVVTGAAYSAGSGVTTTYTPPTGFTEDVDQATSTGSTESSEEVSHQTGWSAGSTGTLTITAASGSTSVGIGYALKAAAAGTNGTATGTFGFTGTAAGIPDVSGTAAGTLGFTGTAAGTRNVAGTAAGALGFTGTAAGTPDVLGTAAGALGFTGTAAGTPDVGGTAVGAFGFTGTAAGVTPGPTATGTFGFTGTATGAVEVAGTAAGTLGFTGAATGIPDVGGTAAGVFGFAGAASGSPVLFGTATGTLGFTGAAAGTVPPAAVPGFGDLVIHPAAGTVQLLDPAGALQTRPSAGKVTVG